MTKVCNRISISRAVEIVEKRLPRSAGEDMWAVLSEDGVTTALLASDIETIKAKYPEVSRAYLNLGDAIANATTIKASPHSDTEECIYRYTAPDGTRYEINWNARRYQHEIFFECKPSASVRDNLKSAGGRWARSGGYWYLPGHSYAGDDVPLVVNGDDNAGCHAAAHDFDERAYAQGHGV